MVQQYPFIAPSTSNRMKFPALRLKKNDDRRLRQGHVWVFSNEVDVAQTPLSSLTAGELVLVADSRGEPFGIAYANPASLICARLLSRDGACLIDHNFLRRRFESALRLRQRLYEKPFYRLVYGESDGLPGLVIDRFGDVLTIQITTAGMERLRELLLSAVDDLLAPRVIVLKNTSGLRQLEGLASYTEVVKGNLIGPVEIEENGVRFLVDPVNGQKTGWFYDHRHNRALAAKLSAGQRVLDLFSYSGAWGVQAAASGAEAVDCVDSSEAALALAAANARLNGVDPRIRSVRDDAFEFLQRARQERRRYDLIILDPPALIKRKKDFKAGVEAYRRINQMALQILAKEGILVSAACSYHLGRDTLHEILRATARHLDRTLIFLASEGQGRDHPVHPAIPETDYLKAFFCAVSTSA